MTGMRGKFDGLPQGTEGEFVPSKVSLAIFLGGLF